MHWSRTRLAAVLALADGRPPTPGLARVLQVVAMAEVALTPTEATVAAARRSRELFERFGDRWGAAFSKLLLAFAAERIEVGPLGAEEGFVTVFPQGTGQPVGWAMEFFNQRALSRSDRSH
jgi:hypothetical protein